MTGFVDVLSLSVCLIVSDKLNCGLLRNEVCGIDVLYFIIYSHVSVYTPQPLLSITIFEVLPSKFLL